MTAPNEPFFKDTTSIVFDETFVELEGRKKRGHMGFSNINHEDMRTTWMNFRWCFPDEADARMKRIWRLGNILEDEIIRIMRSMPGVQFHDRNKDTGKQFNISECGGHAGGSADGIVLGIPEAPKTWHIFESKSAKDSSFKELIKAGSVEKWNPVYYGQVQNYMGAFGLTRTIYAVYNKDTSAIYWERIKLAPGYWENSVILAQDLIELTGPPDSAYRPTDYRIKQYKSEKYQKIYWCKELPKPNCRNCKHSMPMMDGDARWACARWQKDLTIDDQLKGCDLHLFLPALVPAKKIEDHGTLVRYETKDGMELWNSEDTSAHPGAHVYSSAELHAITEQADLSQQFLNSPLLIELRQKIQGTFVSVD